MDFTPRELQLFEAITRAITLLGAREKIADGDIVSGAHTLTHISNYGIECLGGTALRGRIGNRSNQVEVGIAFHKRGFGVSAADREIAGQEYLELVAFAFNPYKLDANLAKSLEIAYNTLVPEGYPIARASMAGEGQCRVQFYDLSIMAQALNKGILRHKKGAEIIPSTLIKGGRQMATV